MAEVPIGTVVAYAGLLPANDNGHLMQVAPGWLLCNGAAVSSQQFHELWNVIKDAHGNGSVGGSLGTDFNLPDYRGLFLRGVSGPRTGAYADPDSGQRSQPQGNTGRSGNEVGSVQSDAFASHSHDVNDPKHTHGANCVDNDGQGGFRSANPSGDSREYWTLESPTGITINPKGGNETRPKNAYVHYIIRTK